MPLVATLTQRQPGVWFARVYLPPVSPGDRGRQVGRLFRGGKKAVAAEVAKWEAELRGTAPAGASAKVADLLRMWQEAKSFDWQPTTARDYRNRCRAIETDLGGVRLVDLDPFRIDAWVAQMRRAGVGEGAVRGRIAALRTACGWGVSRKLLRSNPVAEAKPKTRSIPRKSRLSAQQVVALVSAAAEEGTRASLALRLAAVTGARAAEVVALRWDDVSEGTLHIGRQRHSVDGKPLVRDRTKNGAARDVALDPATVGAIESWRTEWAEAAGESGQWMFELPGEAGAPSPRWLYDVFRRAARRAGVPTGRVGGYVLHDLRHWSASTALRDGHDVVTVAARLGHSPEVLLRVYAQEVEEGQVDVAASLAARFESPSEGSSSAAGSSSGQAAANRRRPKPAGA